MARLQAKTEEQRLHIANILGFAVPIDENGVSSLCYVEFDTLAEIVGFLRQNCERDIVEESHVIAKYEDPNEYARLLDENRKLNNDNFRLLEENKQLKEKTKNLPRIATLNKRIHELKEQLKDGDKQSI